MCVGEIGFEDLFCSSDGSLTSVLTMFCHTTSVFAIAALFFSAVAFATLLTSSRRPVLGTLYSWLPALPRGRRGSASNTPPRSLSPEKKVPSNIPPPVDYKDVFPPSSRELLAEAAKDLPLDQQRKFGSREIEPEEFRKNVISFTSDFRQCGPSTYTPTYVSMEEVEALGDFPDYSKLTGVPLPKPYTEFKIETALARPYRPFRWAYHQTMGM